MTVALTFLAICTLSCRIACISPWWYFMTGHWPVVNDSDLAQPRPSRIDRAPIFALSSTPPGSPVTYRPGMPRAPPAAVIHQGVQHGSGCLVGGIGAVALRLEADGIDRAVHLGYPEDLLDLILGVALRHVDGLAAEGAGLGQPLGGQITDDHDSGAEQLGRGGRGQPDWSGTGDVHRRARLDPRGVRAVEAGREDV